MRAFIVRPFGPKSGIDFDAIENKLISPALDRLEITGRTTAEVMKPGNIREDMFQLLLTADLVIADVTLHNANVYYELGIRHALRHRITVLLRGTGEGEGGPKPDAVPFDLLTDRYLAYQLADPGASIDALVDAIRQGLNSEGRDSPVFALLPKLKSPPVDDFLTVPLGFEEDAARAAWQTAKRDDAQERTLFSGDLSLLAREARAFSWAGAGLRLICRKQFDGKHFESAKLTCEELRRRDERDFEANHKLSTIYHKLGDLQASNLAAERALKRPEISREDRAEIHALRGRNLKAQWLSGVRAKAPEERQAAALGSGLLDEAIAAYAQGFRADLTHYYAGINVLALRTVQYELAKRLPEIWATHFPDDQEASRELEKIQEEISRLQAGVALAVDSAKEFDRQDNAVWWAFTAADLKCLSSKNQARVALAYRNTIEKFRTTHAFALSSARDQLNLLHLVGVLPENVAAALAAFPPLVAEAPSPGQDRSRILLFAGHRVDDANRKESGKPDRFPRTREAEEAAGRAIREKIEQVRNGRGVAFGVAGGASGGDILFHEACVAQGIPTWLYLALPAAPYKDASVRGAGDIWVRRFDKLEADLHARCRVMSDLKSEAGEPDELPRWLQVRKDYGIWQRNNLWMLYGGLAFGPGRVTLIVLWDGKSEGDGPGGTADLVKTARDLGAEVEVIDSKVLFGLG